MEWGTDSKSMVLTAEAAILHKLFTNPGEVIHPFVLVPLVGQIFLIVSLFMKNPKRLVLLGIACISLLYLMLLFISIISLNWKMFISVVPFFVFAIIYIVYIRKSLINK
jgi:CHASE2 domain-containing sensor protein